MPRPKNPTPMVSYNMRIPESVYREIVRLAEERKTSAANVIRERLGPDSTIGQRQRLEAAVSRIVRAWRSFDGPDFGQALDMLAELAVREGIVKK